MKSLAVWKVRQGVRRPLMFALLLLLGICAISYCVALQCGKRAQAGGQLVIEKRYLDFGEVWEKPAFSLTMPIFNTGNDVVHITDFSTTCSCVSVTPRALAIPGGTTSQLGLILNLTVARAAPSRPAAFEARLTPVVSGAPLRLTAWVVTGRVKAFFEVSPSTLSFTVLEGQKPSTKKVKIVTALPVERLTAICAPPIAGLVVKGGPTLFQLEISPHLTLRPGFFSSLIKISAPTADGVVLDKTVSISGLVSQEIEISPPTVILGTVPLGQKAAETVHLVSRSGKPFVVEMWTTSGKDVVVERLGSPTEGAAFKIIQQAALMGNNHSTVVFSVRLADRRLIEVPLRVSYHGTQL